MKLNINIVREKYGKGLASRVATNRLVNLKDTNRKRQRERESDRHKEKMPCQTHTYTYIHMYLHIIGAKRRRGHIVRTHA